MPDRVLPSYSIRVNALAPGYFPSDMTARHDAAYVEYVKGKGDDGTLGAARRAGGGMQAPGGPPTSASASTAARIASMVRRELPAKSATQGAICLADDPGHFRTVEISLL